jgi:hypothetical protein
MIFLLSEVLILTTLLRVQGYAQGCEPTQLILGVWGISLLHLKEVFIRSIVVLLVQATMKETSQVRLLHPLFKWLSRSAQVTL